MNGNAAIVNTYLKRVRTGNIDPYSPDNPIPAASQFLFETVLDYGEHPFRIYPPIIIILLQVCHAIPLVSDETN